MCRAEAWAKKQSTNNTQGTYGGRAFSLVLARFFFTISGLF
jgi:hypothetical protein